MLGWSSAVALGFRLPQPCPQLLTSTGSPSLLWSTAAWWLADEQIIGNNEPTAV
jgi:hypothetical protein